MRRRPLTLLKQPVSPYKQILLELLHGRSNVNSVYRKLRQTGLRGLAYKQKTLDAIKYLEKAGFIADVSGLKRHRSGKEQPKELTALGRELAQLMCSIDQYYLSFSKLTDMIRQTFGVPYMYPKYQDIVTPEIPMTNIQEVRKQNTVLRNILRSKGWSSKAIDQSSELYHKALGLRGILSPELILSIVTTRYAFIISKFNLDDKVDQTIKRDILNEIITNSFSEYVSFMFKEMDKLNALYRINRFDTQFTIDTVINRVVENELSLSIDAINGEEYLDNPFIEKEAIDLLASAVYISRPNPQYIEKRIESLKEFIQTWQSEAFFDQNVKNVPRRYREDIKDEFKRRVEQNRKILAVFELYKGRRN